MRLRRDSDGALHKVVLDVDGVECFVVRWTESCSGCCELGEAMMNAHHYAFDDKAHCYVGSGCDECGYTGKRRREWLAPFEFDARASRSAPPRTGTS